MSEEKATLRDLINYEPDKQLNDEEVALIKNTFNDKRLLSVLRKVLLPTISDPSLPMELLAHDVFLAGINWDAIPEKEIKPIMLGRAEAIKFIIGGLIKLRTIANEPEESPSQAALRRQKDSTK